MRLKYFYIFSLIFGVVIFVLPSVYAQEDYAYTLSVEEYLNNALPAQEGRNINYDEVTGILTVTDTPSNQRLISRLIKQFDIGPRQVLIEAKFVEIEFEELDELGIEWYWYKHGDIEIGDVSTTSYIEHGESIVGWDGADPIYEKDYIYYISYLCHHHVCLCAGKYRAFAT